MNTRKNEIHFLNKANTTDTEAPFLDLHLKFMINVMTEFDIVNFPILDGDVSRRASYGVYIAGYSLLSCCGLQCAS